MRPNTIYFRWLPITILAIGLAGCGGAERPPITETTGVVTFEGEPLSGATVVFAPDSGQRVATGKTNEEGWFELGTFGADDGAIIGPHRVTVISRAPVQEGGGMPGSPTALKPTEAVIPEKYLAPETSGLTAEVTEDGENYFEFKLTK